MRNLGLLENEGLLKELNFNIRFNSGLTSSINWRLLARIQGKIESNNQELLSAQFRIIHQLLEEI